MDVAEIQNRLLQLVRGKINAAQDLDAESQFVLLGEDGVFDSVTALELVLAIEKEFAIVVKDDEVCPENLRNLECLVNFVASALSRRG
ncbi:MAG TPA: acyl carrier protein [Candidatus Binatia bacterium]|jgi:acyl carrier protein|nr:acyl carrier protein [Candidatus Binatia bacterium]